MSVHCLCCFPLSLHLLLVVVFYQNSMGSYGNQLLQCVGCGRWGMCMLPEYIPAHMPELWDIDGVGLLCELCNDDVYPQLILQFFRDKFPIAVADLIVRFAYPHWVVIMT